MIEVLTSAWNKGRDKTKRVVSCCCFIFYMPGFTQGCAKQLSATQSTESRPEFCSQNLKNQPGERTNSIELSSDLLTGSVACLPHQYSMSTSNNNNDGISEFLELVSSYEAFKYESQKS